MVSRTGTRSNKQRRKEVEPGARELVNRSIGHTETGAWGCKKMRVASTVAH